MANRKKGRLDFYFLEVNSLNIILMTGVKLDVFLSKNFRHFIEKMLQSWLS